MFTKPKCPIENRIGQERLWFYLLQWKPLMEVESEIAGPSFRHCKAGAYELAACFYSTRAKSIWETYQSTSGIQVLNLQTWLHN